MADKRDAKHPVSPKGFLLTHTCFGDRVGKYMLGAELAGVGRSVSLWRCRTSLSLAP